MDSLPELSMTGDVYMMFAGGFMLLLTLVVLFSTGSIFAVFTLWVLVAIIVGVLVYFGFIDLDGILGDLVPSTPEAPAAPTTLAPPLAGNPLSRRSEVFYVSDNQFVYDEAPAVCAAYGGVLATLEQVIDAYNGGAEWCGYGWSAGGMALYPTQKATWTELQREVDPGKRTACGRPGVNGGYFDPASKFGVNCYGFKPQGTIELPQPAPGTDTEKFRRMVNQFRAMLASLNLSPFSRQVWSDNRQPVVEKYGNQFVRGGMGPIREHNTGRITTDPEFVEQPGASRIAAPLGLLGATGPIGPIGPIGPSGPVGPPGQVGSQGLRGIDGPVGPVGAASTVPGPRGPIGPTGMMGRDGLMGPTGRQGNPGTPASAGATGPRGPVGPQGIQGNPGNPGAPGPAAVVPKDLVLNSLTLGTWSITPDIRDGGRSRDLTFREGGAERAIIREDNDFGGQVWVTRGGQWKVFN
jgi:hypothetical protein